MAKCKFCKQRAEWAMQFIASDEPSFYTLGSHIRGFQVVKVCETHRETIKAKWQSATPLQKKDFFDSLMQFALEPLG